MDWATFFSHPLFIAAAPAVAAGGMTFVAGQVRNKRLTGELDGVKAELDRKRRRIEELERAGRDSGNPAEAAQARKSALVSGLNDLLDHAGADRATLYLPVEGADDAFMGLLVLATAPTDISDQTFHGTVFAGREAQAVRAFLDREVVQSGATAFAFDDYAPSATYADCLFARAGATTSVPVAVVQLLGKGRTLDAARCAAAIARFGDTLVETLTFFTQDSRKRLARVGLEFPTSSRRGVALMFDISNSTALFGNEARALLTMAVMERVMRAGCSAVARHGGVVENFTGDGFLASFTAGTDNCPARRALSAAQEMRDAFDGMMKDLRPELGQQAVRLLPRFGISTGIVHEISFSVGQMRATSIIGKTASTASLLCSAAPRDCACIAIDPATLLELPERDRSRFRKLPPDALPQKARDRGIVLHLDDTP